MPIQNISLIPEHAERALRLDRLRLSIEAGVAALDRGDDTEVDDESLDTYLDDLAASTHR